MHTLSRQIILFFVGPDMCGKTQIAKKLSSVINVPYFKASSEHDSFLTSKDAKDFLNQLRYADPRVFDVLKQTRYSLIFDRGFPCEYAYSHVLKRETDLTMLKHMDEMWSSIDARIILCRRSDYTHIVDDLCSDITGEILGQIENAYHDFLKWSKCKSYILNVDDEDLEREVNTIIQYLQETMRG